MEPRLVLATGTFVSAVADATSLAVVIDYAGVNQATIGPGDITFAANGRSAVAATVVASVQTRAGGILRVTYGLPAYDGAWGVTDTGTYAIVSPPGAVQDSLGGNLAHSGLASLWMWFGQPKAQMVSQTITPTSWLVVMQYDTLNGLNESTLDGNDITLTGGAASSNSVSQIIHVSPTRTQVVYAIGAPGGAWSYASNGTYSLAIAGSQVSDTDGRMATGHPLGSFYLWFNTPRAEFVSSSAGTINWLVSIKFSAADGTAINPATLVGDGAVTGSGPNGYFEQGHMTTLIHNGDGSYTATFSLPANGGSWDWTDSGTYSVSVAANRVLDLNGAAVGNGQVGTASMSFTAPAATMVLPTNPTRTSWDINVDFTDDVMVDMQSVNVSTIRLQGPDGSDVALQLVSVGFQFPGTVHAHYQLTAPGGIQNGNYQVWVNDGGAQDTAGNPIAENMLASFWLWFS
jgi:hypothetical protein